MMKCNHCGQNEATSRFFVSYMGYSGDVYLCGECLEKLRGHAEEIMGGSLESVLANPSHWGEFLPGEHRGSIPAERPDGLIIPDDAGEELRRRRMMSELKARLETAVKQEDYETAAKLRDEIYRAEKGVCV